MKRVVPENIARCMSEEDGKNNGSNALANALNQLNLPTLAMIMLMGGGNWLATKSTGDLNYHEIQRAATEVHDLYPRLMEALRNQNEMMESQKRQLDNQGTMLKNQDQALQLLLAGERRFLGGGTEHP
jgi:hypothetical protein